MPTIVEHDPSLAEMFQSALEGSVVVLTSLDQLRRHLDSNPSEYVVLLGPSVDITAATELSESLRVNRPAFSVVLIRRRVDTTVLAESLRAGIREVIEDRDLTGMGEAVRRAHALWKALTDEGPPASTTTTGKLVTVFAAKGGVGKSTVATNLAAALVDEGKARVCLVDLDVAFGDVAIMLQLLPAQTIADAVQIPELDAGALQAMLTPHSDGLFALAAPKQPDATHAVSAKRVGVILEMLKSSFDYVVVDTAPSFDDFVLEAFDHTDLLVLVGSLDIPALKNLRVATQMLELLNMPRTQWRLVLNRADAQVGLSPAEVEKSLGVSITTCIPSSREVPASVNRGALIVRDAPRHGVSTSIKALARECLRATSDHATDDAAAPAAATRKRGGWLRRKVRVS